LLIGWQLSVGVVKRGDVGLSCKQRGRRLLVNATIIDAANIAEVYCVSKLNRLFQPIPFQTVVNIGYTEIAKIVCDEVGPLNGCAFNHHVVDIHVRSSPMH